MNLILQPLSLTDLTVLAAGAQPALAGLRVLPEALPPGFIATRSLKQLAEGKSMRWCSGFAMVDPTARTVVGGCGFKDAPQAGCVEIGYGVSPEARGQGLATAAVYRLLSLAFESDEVCSVLAQVNPDNLASTRVVTKAGFVPGGLQQDAEGEWLLQWHRSRSSAALAPGGAMDTSS